MLLDSNIIIYSAQPEHSQLRELIVNHSPAVSALSYLEVLGDHLLTEQQRQYFEEFFHVAQVLQQVLQISQDVLIQAVALRQQQRMTLGDAIIAGIALVHELTRVTRNVADFRRIAELNLLNPFDPV